MNTHRYPPSKIHRRAALKLGAASLLFGSAAQTHAQQPGAARAPLQLVGAWEIEGLEAAKSGHLFMRMQVVETLVGARDDGTLEPALARRWTVSPDGLTWRFELRPNARFHDGTPLDATAVIRNLEIARAPPSLLSGVPIKSIEADGAGAVLVRLTRRHGSLAARLAHSTTLILAPASFGPGNAVRSIIGTGPYRITLLEAPQRLETVVHEQYDGPRPQVSRARYLAASRAETRALMAESGQSDIAYNLDPASLVRLRQRKQVRIVAVMLPRTVMVKVNAGHEFLRDVRVRQALSLAIDRTGIARALLRDPEMAATQLFSPALAAWQDPSLPPLRFDAEEARRLLEAAGWKRTLDGLRDAAGRPFALTLRTYPDRPELPLLASALQAQFRQIGIAVRVAIGNSGDIPLYHRDGTLELGLVARNYGSVPDPIGTLLGDFDPKGGDWGAMGWNDPDLDGALSELSLGTASAERTRELRHRVAARLHAGLPVIPIVWYRQQVAVSQRITGVNLDPLERTFRLTGMEWQT